MSLPFEGIRNSSRPISQGTTEKNETFAREHFRQLIKPCQPVFSKKVRRHDAHSSNAKNANKSIMQSDAWTSEFLYDG